ncbi:MAG: alpha/beta hydrolase [Pyrinomonadaceae bacterium]|nr:alpha/beta hydrolase [Pyrinomonadaceae bacterium]
MLIRRLLFTSLVFALASLLSSGAAAKEAAKESAVSGLADVNGTRLFYEMAGRGRTVVLIHGGLVDSRLWDDQFREFAKHYRVIRYDLRGFGRSGYPASAFSHVEDLYALLKFLKVERCSLVGLSLGSMIAADFTLEHPEMVERLVLTAPGLRGSTAPRNERARAVYKLAETQGRDKAIDAWMENDFFATGKSNNPAYEERMRAMLRDNYKTWGPTPTQLVWNWPKWQTTERLEEIKAPTLIIAGDKDAPSIMVNVQIYESKIPGARKIIITNVSHHLVMEKPAEYNRLVLDFLKRASR